jgi:hypothetical protein
LVVPAPQTTTVPSPLSARLKPFSIAATPGERRRLMGKFVTDMDRATKQSIEIKAISTTCRNCLIPLDYGHESPDKTGTNGSLYCPGFAVDRLGGEIVSYRTPTPGSDSVGETLTCKKSILTKRWS